MRGGKVKNRGRGCKECWTQFLGRIDRLHQKWHIDGCGHNYVTGNRRDRQRHLQRRDAPLRNDRRALVNAIFYVVRAGCAWRLLPKDFGPWQTVYGYFRRWSQDWIWTFIHDTLRNWLRYTEGRNVAPTAAIIDSQSVKTPDQAEDRGYDAGKKIKGRKRHVAVDVLGLVLAIMITPAAVQDRDAAKPLKMFGRLQIIWADGGYLGALVRWVKELRPSGKLKLEIVRCCDQVKRL
ncbi:MAG TPA: IS5 family transposase [Verrucomicrobiae bacterium]